MRCSQHIGGGLGEGVLTGDRSEGRTGTSATGSDWSFRAALFADAGLTRAPDGALLVSGVSIDAIARAVGTPAFVYNGDAVRQKYTALDAALGRHPHRIQYAVKANGNLALLHLLKRLGAGCDIVSGGELERALAAGFAPERIVFSGVGKSRDELMRACRVGIGQMNLESLEELDALEEIAFKLDRPVRTGIRVNPSVTVDTHPFISTGTAAAKFGIPADQVVSTAMRVAGNPALRLTGLAMHVGSQLLDITPYVEGARRLARLVGEIRGAGIGTLESLDLGGGLGIRYHSEQPLEPSRLAQALLPILQPLGLELQLEPGRYLVGSAGLLLTSVLYRKHAGGKDFAVVDAGMSDLVRPSHYMAYHDIVLASDPGRPTRVMDVVGPICESGDFLALDRQLPQVEQGEVLAILGAGAYGFVMGSTYNARPRPAEVLVESGRWGVARARETVESLMAGEVVDPLRFTISD